MRRLITILTIMLFTLCASISEATAQSHTDVCNNKPAQENAMVKQINSIFDLLYFNASNLSSTQENNHANNVHSSVHKQLRFRRLQEFTIDIKQIIVQLSSLDTLFTLEQSRFYHSNQLPGYTQATCDYYVFALRHIII